MKNPYLIVWAWDEPMMSLPPFVNEIWEGQLEFDLCWYDVLWPNNVYLWNGVLWRDLAFDSLEDVTLMETNK